MNECKAAGRGGGGGTGGVVGGKPGQRRKVNVWV